MNLDSLITFLGWATLTYSWLHINFTFASAISQAIEKHNDAIREARTNLKNPMYTSHV